MATRFRRVSRALRLALIIVRLEHEHATTIDYIIIDDCAYDPRDTSTFVNIDEL